MSEHRIAEAARARRGAVTQRTNRPSQRRGAAAPTTTDRPAVAFRSVLAARDQGAAAGTVHFHGLATTYEQPYEMHDYFGPYNEVVTAGAASKTLARADLDVPLVLQHQQLRRIARTTAGDLTLTESDRGLEVDAPRLDLEDQDVAYIVPKIRNGHIDEMSFAFLIVRGSWSPDFTEYRIDEFDLHRGDVAIVGLGANPNTTGTLRAQQLTGLQLIGESETRMLMYL